MTTLQLILWSVGALMLCAPVTVLLRKYSSSKWIYAASALACSVIFLLALFHLLNHSAADEVLQLPLGLPWQGAHFRLDALAAFFLMIVNLGGTAASVYGIGYTRHESSPQRVVPFFVVFIAAMNLVVLADGAFMFLLNWELMSLTSWALVMAHHKEPKNIHAGFVYLVMASLGTLVLLMAFGLMAGPGGEFSFAMIREHGLSPGYAGLVLVLAMVGAGSKAGVVPLHAWLPLAHPAAPSHVSALMSGVMTKVAIFGFIRIAFDLLGQPVWWWAVLVLIVGSITAVVGVLYALMQHDLKKLLAYHTVENIGIIFIGLGLALAFKTAGLHAFAALALTAGLFHALNHSMFKSLLFFGAGAVLTATGEKDMERMGGLIHRMPVTAFAFLAGSLAISAVPPLNGFVSEWLTFQAVLVSPMLEQWSLRLVIPVAGAMLALSAALAAACFVKAFGITFLGRARSDAAACAHEVDRFSLGTMLAIALLSLLAGVFPGYIIDSLAPLTRMLVGGTMPLQSTEPWLSIVPNKASLNSYNGMLVLIFIAVSASLAAYIIHNFASRALRRSDAWDCGFPNSDPATQYTAGSFAQPIRRVFGQSLFQLREETEIPPQGDTSPARFKLQLRDRIWSSLYAPIDGLVFTISQWLNKAQALTIRRYLALVLTVLVSMLLLVVALR